MKRFLLLAAVSTLFAGCAARDEEAAARLDEQQTRIADLQKAVQDAVKAAQLPRAPSEEDRARDQRIARLEARLDEVVGRLAKLEEAARPPAPPAPTAVESATNAAAAAGPAGRAVVRYQNKPPVISIYNAGDNRIADFLVTPTGDNPDLFPVRVSGITGRRVATGTHPTTRLVETNEIYKDDFGRERKRMKEVTETVSEYAYEVAFAVENLTRTEKVLSISAGEVMRMLTLQPGERRADLTIRSVQGASLRVEAGAEFKRYAIPYE